MPLNPLSDGWLPQFIVALYSPLRPAYIGGFMLQVRSSSTEPRHLEMGYRPAVQECSNSVVISSRVACARAS